MAGILLIDDSNTIRRTGEMLLRRMGHTVFTAGSVMEACCVMTDGKIAPDIIFVDITMPKIDGHAFCSLVRANKRFNHIPLVVLSSKDALTDHVKSSITGATLHINKPFTAEDLETAISICLKVEKQREIRR